MPRVRQYGAPQVQRTQMPGARLSTDTNGAFAPIKPVDISPALEATAREYQVEKEKADQVALTGADAQLSKAETEMLVGPNGVLNREGKDAFSAHDELVANWQKTVSDISTGLKNDRQKMAFQKQVTDRWASIDRQVQQHVASEGKKYDAEQTDGLVTNERDAAIKLWTDPERIQQSIDRQVAAIKDFGARHGASPEHVTDMVSNAISATHAGVISQMLANDQDITAENYFKQHQDQINGVTTQKLTKDLEEGSLRGKSQRESDKILATAKSRTESDDMVKAITDPKLRDEVDRRVDQGWRDKKERQREGEDEQFKQAVNMLEAKRVTSAAGVRAAIPPSLWNNLPLSHRNALMNYAENEIGGGSGSGASGAGAASKWLDFLDMEPAELGKLTRAELETKYLQYLGKGDRRTAISRWDRARHADPAELPALKSQFTLKDQITQSLTVNAAGVPKEDKVFVANVEREVAMKRERAVRAKGKALTDSEEQAIVDDVVIRHVFSRETASTGEVRRTLYGQVKVVNRDGVSRVPLSQVPARRVDEIRARIQGRVTNDKIERAYAAFVIGDMARFNAIMGEQ